MSDEKSLGKLISTARKRLGMNQGDLAGKVGANRVTISRWENDTQRLDVYYLPRLIEKLNLNEQEVYRLYYAGGKQSPERYNLPLSNRFFTGRKAYLEKLRELLEADRIVALSGLGGIGKTQIALKYAHQHHPDLYPTALWVNAADTMTLQAGFASLAETLNLPEKDEIELGPRIKAVRRWLEEYTNWLLVMDNADELPIVQPFLLARPHGHIILTTRWQFPEKFARSLTVEAIGTEDGLFFLLRREGMIENEAKLDTVDADTRHAASQLVEELGGHALALEQAGAYIQETGVSFTDYLRLYQENRNSLLDQYGALGDEHSEHPLTVAATFKTSLKKAAELCPMADDIVRFCAFLQPDAIPEELFQHDESFKSDDMVFSKGIASLRRYSLIKRNVEDKTLSLHRLVQVVLTDTLSFELRKQWRERAVRALHVAFPEIDFHYSGPILGRCRRLIPHVLACTTWTEDELNLTVEVAELFYRAGVYLKHRTWYLDAEPLLTKLFTIYEQHLQAEHFVPTLHKLATLYFEHGKYSQAEHLYQQVLAILEKQVGTQSLETAIILRKLAVVYSIQDKHSQAEPLHQQAVANVEKQLGPEHLETARYLHHMAMFYDDQFKYNQAEPLLIRVLSIVEKQLGIEHPQTGVALGYLAQFYITHGKYKQGGPPLQRAVAIMEKHLGADNKDLALPLFVLAFIVYSQGEHEKAEVLYRRSLSVAEQHLRADYPDSNVKTTFSSFANLLDRIDLIGEYADRIADEIDFAMSWLSVEA